MFVNQNRIIIPTNGPATPYPSPIQVAGLSGEILQVTVTLQGLTHPVPDDLDIVVVSPSGERVMLMSDAGGDLPTDGAVLTFSDNATAVLPDSSPRIVSGIYRPTNYAPNDSFPAPGPPPPYEKALAVFQGKNPNGLWRLFVLDDAGPLGGIIAGGWRLDILTTNIPPEITRQPQDKTVFAGESAQFNVVVTGTPPFEYQWIHNGQILVPFGQGSDTLTISKAKAGDAGTYVVVVTNVAGNAVSRPALLQVIGPLDVVVSPAAATVQPGACVTFQANIAAVPPVLYQWTLNGTRLPDETNSTLRICPASISDGGHYAVVVWKNGEAKRSSPGLLIVSAATDLPPEDKFDARPKLERPLGTVQGNSRRASVEPGEPVKFGGGRTVWLEWIAAANGVVTFSTRGSAFDTLLCVYTGSTMAELKLVTSDNDSGPGYTSELKFNARAGTPYQIQLDGFGIGGSGGEFTLSWNLDRAALAVPVIVKPPESQSVGVGRSAVFSVQTESANDRFQWFFNGKAIAGENQDTLVIRDAGSKNVGIYRVGIQNALNQIITSPPFQLQVGSHGLPLVQDKFETMYATSGNAGFIGIGLGNSFFTEVPAEASGSEGDPTPCGGPFFGTLWQGLNATNAGVIQVETTGSLIPARLAVYFLTGGEGDFTNDPVICDLTSASNGVPAIAKFNAKSGTNYTVIVEGLGSGNLHLTSKMGIAPSFSSPLQYCAVSAGGGVVLGMPAGASNWCPLPSCQWQFNGVNILDATNTTLLVTNFNETMVGTYSVVVSNFVGTATSPVAYLLMAGPFTLSYSWLGAAGASPFKLVISNTAPFVIQAAAAITGPWNPVATNPDPCFILLYTNTSPGLESQRFFRAAPWSPP